jgi:hypothetical protein
MRVASLAWPWLEAIKSSARAEAQTLWWVARPIQALNEGRDSERL